MIAYVKMRHSVLFIISAFLLISPAVSFADAGRIFKENSRAVVVVVAYDGKGNAISQGSGLKGRSNPVFGFAFSRRH